MISFYTDAKDFTLLRICTLYAVSIGLLCAFFNILSISFIESVAGAIFGYFLLWSIAYVYRLVRSVDGLGNGDPELLALIGSFCGISGCLTILFIASVLGSLYGFTLCSIKQNYTLSAKFPFGPFLIIATLLWLTLQPFDLLCHQ
jgi:prepilin signal peptidase PulO-like enzyme (type II secretory pathway)